MLPASPTTAPRTLEDILQGPTTISRKARKVLADYGVRVTPLPAIEVLSSAHLQQTLSIHPSRITWPDTFEYRLLRNGTLLYVTVDSTPDSETVLFVTMNDGAAWQHTDVAVCPW